ncbi:MAG: hypothetical protein R2824_29040 [Saprospiraceae bacterium]|nr:hypothetical protein [Lewinella sp.]
MKNAFYFLLLALFTLTTPACQKALYEEDLVYVGAWSSDRYFIEIAANGFGFYQKRNNGLKDCRVKIKNSRIVFDWDGGRKSFRIDNPPSIELTTGRIYMTLNGRDFYQH